MTNIYTGTFFLIAFLKLLASSILTCVSLGKMAADASEGAKAKAKANIGNNMVCNGCE